MYKICKLCGSEMYKCIKISKYTSEHIIYTNKMYKYINK